LNVTQASSSASHHANRSNAIGVFDSGIGGLSVLRHLQSTLPHESFVYFADSAYAPYGDKTEQEIIERSFKIVDFLLQQSCKAIVIACNTATAAAVAQLRQHYPDLIIVGMEPGLKPAAVLSQSKKVGVLATRATIASEKFTKLSHQLQTETAVEFIPQACVGLVNQIETGNLHSAEIEQLLLHYVQPLLQQGVDSLVLGCTHYPFVIDSIQKIISQYQHRNNQHLPAIHIIDTGKAVARRLQTRLNEHNLLQPELATTETNLVHFFTSADSASLARACAQLLQIQNAAVEHTEI
jgi:glutamate racemase